MKELGGDKILENVEAGFGPCMEKRSWTRWKT